MIESEWANAIITELVDTVGVYEGDGEMLVACPYAKEGSTKVCWQAKKQNGDDSEWVCQGPIAGLTKDGNPMQSASSHENSDG